MQFVDSKNIKMFIIYKKKIEPVVSHYKMTNENLKPETWRTCSVSVPRQLDSFCGSSRLLLSAAATQTSCHHWFFSSQVGKQQWEMQFRRDQCNWGNRLKAKCCIADFALYFCWLMFDMLGIHVQVQGPEKQHLNSSAQNSSFHLQ